MLENLTDNQLRSMPIGKLEQLYNNASSIGALNEFNEVFWARLAEIRCNDCNLQNVLYLLEDYKKTIGRAIDKNSNPLARIKYNEIENNIAWLAEEYKLRRKTKAFKVKV
jgi:phosphatidylserine/phosphatidylglycerophosphate/cardiolipin synthase-like enzyme